MCAVAIYGNAEFVLTPDIVKKVRDEIGFIWSLVTYEDFARIYDIAKGFGADVVMTRPEHENGTERIAEVATISAGDDTIGKLIADVIEKVGKDGVVTVEAGQGLELESEVVEGFSIDRGWVSPFFVTDSGRQEAVYEKPAILVTDKKISSVAEFAPILEKFFK